MSYHLIKAIEWMHPIVYLVGLVIAVWAFRRCRRWGYLAFATYFAFFAFSLLAMPSINRAINAHRPPDYDEQTRQKIDAAVQQAVDRVLAEEGRPQGIPEKRMVEFPFGPMLLVAGLWILAKGEKDQRNHAFQPTATSTGVFRG